MSAPFGLTDEQWERLLRRALAHEPTAIVSGRLIASESAEETIAALIDALTFDPSIHQRSDLTKGIGRKP